MEGGYLGNGAGDGQWALARASWRFGKCTLEHDNRTVANSPSD